MTSSLIALISILAGIIGANSTGLLFKKFSFGLIGNTILGVFGSILLIKSFGRLGFDPNSIIKSESSNYTLFFINMLTSTLGGVLAVLVLYTLKNKLSRFK